MRRDREQRAGDRLPYSRAYDERTIVLRDGSLMQSLHLEGFAFETAETADLNYRHAMRDAALKAIASSRFVIHHHILRRRVTVDLAADYADPVCAEIDRRWRERMASRRLFVNNLFVSLVRRPPKGKAGLADRLSGLFARGMGATEREAALAREIRELDAAREALQSGLAAYAPRLLSGYDTAHGRCSEPMEMLSALYNGELRPVLAPSGDVGRNLPYKRTSLGAEALEQ